MCNATVTYLEGKKKSFFLKYSKLCILDPSPFYWQLLLLQTF